MVGTPVVKTVLRWQIPGPPLLRIAAARPPKYSTWHGGSPEHGFGRTKPMRFAIEAGGSTTLTLSRLRSWVPSVIPKWAVAEVRWGLAPPEVTFIPSTGGRMRGSRNRSGATSAPRAIPFRGLRVEDGAYALGPPVSEADARRENSSWPMGPTRQRASNARARRRRMAARLSGWQGGPRCQRARWECDPGPDWRKLAHLAGFVFIFFLFSIPFSFLSIFKPKFEFKLKLITTTFVCGIRGIKFLDIFIYIYYLYFPYHFSSSHLRKPYFFQFRV
jgi:hypothetical protein